MDVLSDTLRVVRLTGAVFLKAKLTPPWSVESATPGELAEYLRLPSDCIAVFHILAQGHLWLSVPGSSPVLLRSGDAVLIPRNVPHVTGSDQGMIPVPFRSILPPLPPGGIAEVEVLGMGEITRLVCGYLHCDQRFNPLLGALPEVIVVHRCNDGQDMGLLGGSARGSSAILSIQPGDWLETTLQHTAEEALGEHPGNSDMLARLSEILFVEVVRRYMRRLSPSDHGWLAGVQDPIVGQTLRLLHAQPGRAWTIGELADAAAVSRSTLAQRFTALIGETPMRYLAGWRIHLAKHLLKETDMRLAEVAERVGYESEAAFNRAFKRLVGWPPATWRATGENQRDAVRASAI